MARKNKSYVVNAQFIVDTKVQELELRDLLEAMPGLIQLDITQQLQPTQQGETSNG